jgi:hypothetical protein
MTFNVKGRNMYWQFLLVDLTIYYYLATAILFKNYVMKKLYKISALAVLSLCICVSTLYAQTVVYSNSFPGVGGLSPFPGGAPPATFTALSGNSDASLGSASGTQIGGTVGGSLLLTDNQLATWTTVATVPGTTNNGYAFTSAPLAGYLAPFDPTISLCTQVITWTFNIRTGCTSSR